VHARAFATLAMTRGNHPLNVQRQRDYLLPSMDIKKKAHRTNGKAIHQINHHYCMKVREVMRILQDNGWEWVRTTGSHRIFHHPTKSGIVVVAGKFSDDVRPGTLASI